MAGRPVRVYLEVSGDARFLSHLDLLRVLERAIRRSRLEVDYTEGFHPRIRISLPQAVPVGVGSSGDHFTIRVDPGVTPETIMSRLAEVFPRGIRIAGVEEGPPSREPRWVRLSIEVINGHAAASSAATALRERGDDCYSRITAHEDAVILELSGEGTMGRPPRTREVVECVEKTLLTLGFDGGIGEVVRQIGQMPEDPADS